MEMKDEVVSSAGSQFEDTSGYQESDLDDVEFYWENDWLDVNAVFRPGIDTPFSSSTFNVFEIGSMPENPNQIDEEQDKEDFLLYPTAPISERPTQPPVLMRSRAFGTKFENVPDCVYRNSFEYFIVRLFMLSKINYI